MTGLVATGWWRWVTLPHGGEATPTWTPCRTHAIIFFRKIEKRVDPMTHHAVDCRVCVCRRYDRPAPAVGCAAGPDPSRSATGRAAASYMQRSTIDGVPLRPRHTGTLPAFSHANPPFPEYPSRSRDMYDADPLLFRLRLVSHSPIPLQLDDIAWPSSFCFVFRLPAPHTPDLNFWPTHPRCA